MRPVVAVLGGGRLGQAVAEILGHAGATVLLWARRKSARRTLAKKLDRVGIVDSVSEACEPAQLVFFAVPASGFREVAAQFGDSARGDHLVVHGTRGVETGFVLPHQILREETCVRKIGVLGGPLHVRDLRTGRPLATVLASRYDEVCAAVMRMSEGSPVRVHASRDVTGVEVAGVISHVSALAVGMSDALQLGDTARGVLLTRGLVEATRIGIALGADPATFGGLAGVGDLIPRKVASTQRHHQVGAALVAGRTLEDILSEVKSEVEGVVSAQEAVRLGERIGLDLPLIQAIDMVIHGEADARPAIEDVLQLDIDLVAGLVTPAR